jgi:WD40-like Beta Propeller Repeat
MDDRLRVLDLVDPPEQWAEIERRVPRPMTPSPPSGPRRALTVLVALAVAVAGVGGAVLALSQLGGPGSVSPSPGSSPPVIAPKSNGVIAFSAAGELRTVDPNGSSVDSIDVGRDGVGGISWSPDGLRLVFDATYYGDGAPKGGYQDIFAADADGSNVEQLTDNEGSRLPAWSPDGSRIAYTHQGPDGGSQIFVMNADGSGQTQLTSGDGFSLRPNWSPDGSRVAFESVVDRNSDIFVMEADGSGVARLTSDPSHESNPVWSPDGLEIAFTSDRHPSGVYVMEADGTGERLRISDDDVANLGIAWSPDGHALALSSDRGAGFGRAIYVLDLGSGSLEQLTERGAIWGPAWQPLPQGRVQPLTGPSASAPAPLTQGTAQFDPEDGVWLLSPRDWSFLPHPSGPDEPETLFAIANYPIGRGGECAPTAALETLPADGVLAWMIEYHDSQGDDFPSRPDRFSLDPSSLANYECSGTHASYRFRFQDAGRYFQVHVVLGNRASDEVRDEVLASLSSLLVDRCAPVEGPVLVSEFGTLSPDRGSAGDSISLSGPTGRDENWFWSPLDKIEVWWSSRGIGVPQETSDQHLMATIEPGESCSFNAQFRVPRVSPGRYLVTVLFYFAEQSQGYGLAAERTFTVTD